MAQLRDVKTGELVFEGTPLECVVHAGELGGAAVVPADGGKIPDGVELVYDDVGLGFNPDAVLDGARQDADGLAAAARGAKGEAKADLAAAATAAKAALKPNGDATAAATAELERARGRLKG